MSPIAWPELRPGAADPLISAERNKLKWLITCGVAVCSSVTRLSNEIIFPVSDFT